MTDPNPKEGEQLEPLLNDDELRALLDDEAEDAGVDDEEPDGEFAWSAMLEAGKAVRDLYEASRLSDKARIKELEGLVEEMLFAGAAAIHVKHYHNLDRWNAVARIASTEVAKAAELIPSNT